MASHVAAVWGALRHRVPETLSRPEPETPQGSREPAPAGVKGATGRPWAAMTLLAFFGGLVVNAVVRTWTGEGAADLRVGDQRALFVAAAAAGVLAAVACVAAVAAGLARRRTAAGGIGAVAALLGTAMAVLGEILPDDAVHHPPVLLGFIAAGLATSLPVTPSQSGRPDRGYAPASTERVA